LRKRAQDDARRVPRDIGHGSEFGLTDIDLHRLATRWRGQPAAAQLQQHGNETLGMVADHEVVADRDGDLQVGEADQRKAPPRHGILGNDRIDGV